MYNPFVYSLAALNFQDAGIRPVAQGQQTCQPTDGGKQQPSSDTAGQGRGGGPCSSAGSGQQGCAGAGQGAKEMDDGQQYQAAEAKARLEGHRPQQPAAGVEHQLEGLSLQGQPQGGSHAEQHEAPQQQPNVHTSSIDGKELKEQRNPQQQIYLSATSGNSQHWKDGGDQSQVGQTPALPAAPAPPAPSPPPPLDSTRLHGVPSPVGTSESTGTAVTGCGVDGGNRGGEDETGSRVTVEAANAALDALTDSVREAFQAGECLLAASWCGA